MSTGFDIEDPYVKLYTRAIKDLVAKAATAYMRKKNGKHISENEIEYLREAAEFHDPYGLISDEDFRKELVKVMVASAKNGVMTYNC